MRVAWTIVACVLLSSSAFAGSYEMKDLEALEKQESWEEALMHLADIPPSKRNDGWQRIAEKAASGVLLQLVKTAEKGPWSNNYEARQVLEMANALPERYPLLNKSKVFLAARADAGLRAFDRTYSDSRHSTGDDPWRDELAKFVEADHTTADLPLRAGKLVAKRLVAYCAMPFFIKAVATSSAACKEADVTKALVSSLSYSEWTDEAKKIAAGACWGEVRPALEAELNKGGAAQNGDTLKKNACPLFAAKKVTLATCK